MTNRGERRATGSYYTPDHIVDNIIQKTLAPLCTVVSNELLSEIEKLQEKYEFAMGEERERISTCLEKLRSDFDDRVLRLRVLDPGNGLWTFPYSSLSISS